MKKIIVGLFIVVLSVWSFLLLNKNNEIVKVTVVEEKVSQGSDMSQPQRRVTSNRDSLSTKYNDVFEQKQMSSLCKFDSSIFSEKLFLGDISPDTLLDKQKHALDSLREKCEGWYRYFAILSEAEKIQIKKTAENFAKPNNWYEPNIDLETRLHSAKNALLDDPEGMEFSALYFLLLNDNELIQELGQRIETNYREWIKSSSQHIVTLYNCSYKSNDCSPSSLIMLSLCLSEEQYCGYSYKQYLASIYSYGQFFDIQNIVSYLREIIKKGYPDIVFK